jgi:hypothetical protein
MMMEQHFDLESASKRLVAIANQGNAKGANPKPSIPTLFSRTESRKTRDEEPFALLHRTGKTGFWNTTLTQLTSGPHVYFYQTCLFEQPNVF